MGLSQRNRLITIDLPPLAADALAIKSLLLEEQLGRLFNLEIELLSEDANLNFNDVLGQNATLRLQLAGGNTRFFNGYVSRFVQTGWEDSFARYRATVVPWFWFLTRSADCRIFQNKTIPDIITEVFNLHGFADFKLALTEKYKPWEYCVQYRETAFNFVSRLMEQEGIYYFFEHEKGKHTMVLADSQSAHQNFPNYASISFRPDRHDLRGKEVIFDWLRQTEIQAGEYRLNEFNFLKPKSPLLANSKMNREHAYGDLAIYDYPGEYEEQAEGEGYAKVRLQEAQAQHEIVRGEGNSRGLCTGCLFTLKDYLRQDQNREYLVTSASYLISNGDFEAGGNGQPASYVCRFSAIPSSEVFRPARLAPKPLIQGPQTAMVAGSGDIDPDNLGRVQVHFHWDRDKKDSCRIRVSQTWGGKGWGSMFIPHVGQEVIVEFEEGDPDRPIITGRVYNPDEMPPLELPANKSKSVIRDHGKNELIMEGNAGEEYIQIKQAYGNEIKMDAKAKTINFHCPTHGTDLLMGKSFNFQTTSDWIANVSGNKIQKIGGNNKTVDVGLKHSTVLGARTEITVGTKSELDILNKSTVVGGWNNTVVAGANSQVLVGVQLVINKAKTLFKKPQLVALIKEYNEYTGKYKEKCDDYLSKARKLCQEAGQHQMKARKSNWLIKGLHKAEANRLVRKAVKMENKAETALYKVNDAKWVVSTMKIG